MKPVGVLALQGSFPLHERALRRLGVDVRRVRRAADLEGLRGLIIPGGESTTMSHLAREYELFEPLVSAARRELPIFGTCAGAILLARGDGDPPTLGVAPIGIERNAYGRQVDSFTAPISLSFASRPIHGVFIRAPRLAEPDAGSGAEVFARHEGSPVLLRWSNLLLGTFHPELTEDLLVHRYFLGMCGGEEE